jgi:ADP-heptose:LPS heptosyltransferase
MAGKKHIIAIRLSAMGDVAMAVPVLRALLAQHPNVKITVVSRETFRPFFEGMKRVSFFAADVNGRHKGFMGLIRLYKDLKTLKVYAVADLHNVLRSKIVSALFSFKGKKTATIDKGRTEKKALTRANNKAFVQLPTVTKRYSDVFEKLGFRIDLSNPQFPDKLPLSDSVASVTGHKSAGKWIGIAPFAQHRSKIYPLDLMGEVIDTLAKSSDNKIFLFGGGKSETETLKKLAGEKTNVLVVAGKMKLKQELQLIQHLDVMLSMDSGNAHIAAMLGVEVVTLWGATHPFAGFAPFNQPLENALVSDREQYPMLPTSVYGNKKVEGYDDAMRTISPQDVVNKIEELIKKG